MKRLSPVLLLAFLPFFSLSCTHDTTYTLAGAYEGRILVAQEKEMMERMVDCAVARRCDHLSIMELLPSGRVFLVEAGTEVTTAEGPLAFSDIRKVRIQDGDHRGETAWVYDRMLHQDRRSVHYQHAFARLYLMGTN